MTTIPTTLTLIGGPPWGFRISGGKDQNYPPHVSQVNELRNDVLNPIDNLNLTFP